MIQQKLGDRWQYVIQHDYGNEPGAGVERHASASWYGIDQYLFHTINERWKAGMRFEWFRDENGSRVPGAGQTGDYFELDGGRELDAEQARRRPAGTPLGLDRHARLYPFGDGTRSNQVLLDCDVIVRF